MDREQTTAPPDGLSDAISKIMAHPELISMVASALGGAAPKEVSMAEAKSDIPEEDPPVLTEVSKVSAPSNPPGLNDTIAALAPILGSLTGKGGLSPQKDDKQACLLRALKPYVSSGRGQAIDYMIRLSQISDLMKHLS